MRLLALSDLHLGFRANREALAALPSHPADWLILAGDLGETRAHLELAFATATARFARVLWVPGNHELWTVSPDDLRGVAKYQSMVALARSFGVLTPEDEYAEWPGPGGPLRIALLFLGYDYSLRPPTVPAAEAVAWAREAGVACADEMRLHPDPYPSRTAWCAARCAEAEERLAAAAARGPLVLVNHYPLLPELVRIPRIPRFRIWSGTARTADWPWRFGARVAVAGHLHLRTTDWVRGVRFEEVSLGYPRQWHPERGLAGYLREILPGPVPGGTGTVVHR